VITSPTPSRGQRIDRPGVRRWPSPRAWRLYGSLPAPLRARMERVELVRRLKRRAVGVDAARVLRLVGAFEAAGVPVWLAGGWGVDALAGCQTRWHHDLDLVVRAEDDLLVRRCLASLGFEPYTASVVPWAGLPHSQVFRDRIGRHVDVHPVSVAVRSAAGQGTAILTEDAFSTGSIAGHRVGCLSPEVQRAFHRGYPPRDQDLQDLATLRTVLARRREGEAPPELPVAARSFDHRHNGPGSGHDRDRSLDPGAPGTA
jgi:lincosamide nucleotidyltransferase A/C/D/E